MIEWRGGPGQWRRLSASAHLGQVERLVLVVEMPVRLVRHGADVVHGGLLGHQGEEGAVRHPVVVQRVDPLPVALSLGRRVLVVEDQPAAGPRPPLQVEVAVLGPLGVADGPVDRVQRFLLHLINTHKKLYVTFVRK